MTRGEAARIIAHPPCDPQLLGQIGDIEPPVGCGDIGNKSESDTGTLQVRAEMTISNGRRAHPFASSPSSLKGTGYGTEKGRPLNSNLASWKAKSIRSEGSTNFSDIVLVRLSKKLDCFCTACSTVVDTRLWVPWMKIFRIR